MTTIIGTVKIISVKYLDDDVYEGDIPRESYENARTEEYECEDVEEAVRVIQREGLTFAATGTDWAANPDGSYTSNYETGEQTAQTAHLHGFSDANAATIILVVG